MNCSLNLLTPLAGFFKLGLEGLQLVEVLVLNLCELGLNNVQFLLVLEVGLTEPIRELSRLLTVQALIVLGVLLLLSENLLCCRLQLFSLHFC